MDKKYLKEFGLLLGLIIVVSIIARFIARGETLEEYDKKRNASAAISSEENIEDVITDNSGSETQIKVSDSEVQEPADTDSIESSNVKPDSPDITETQTNDTAISNSDDTLTVNPERVEYMDGFYFEPLSDVIIARITGISYVENDNISLDDLRYCSLLYNDFEGNSQQGEMICNKAIAQDVLEIFYELYSSGYQIESIKLIDEFDGDDTASMLANNTSCFNYRVVDNTTRLSNHAYGLAIDLNPFYNPYITYGKDGSTHISPEGSEAYADRSANFPYKIDENDLAFKLFKQHGFKWGGDWNSVKDFQHFEKK